VAEEQPKDAANDRPKAFQSLTGRIGGVTALLVALGGLVAAYRNLLPASAPAPSSSAAQHEVGPDSGSSITQAQAPASYTTGDGGALEMVDGMWVWTTKDGDEFRYKEVSNDGITTVAVLKGGGEKGADVYLRWPNAGGQAFQSFDDQATWTDPIKLTPVS